MKDTETRRTTTIKKGDEAEGELLPPFVIDIR